MNDTIYIYYIPETAGKIYSSDRVAWLLGFPCAVGLMVLAVCNCEDEPQLHYAGALVYFLGFSLWCLCCSFQEIGVRCKNLFGQLRATTLGFECYLETPQIMTYSSLFPAQRADLEER